MSYWSHDCTKNRWNYTFTWQQLMASSDWTAHTHLTQHTVNNNNNNHNRVAVLNQFLQAKRAARCKLHKCVTL